VQLYILELPQGQGDHMLRQMACSHRSFSWYFNLWNLRNGLQLGDRLVRITF